ncbi:Aldehyde/histidinol dehydrogenase [Pilobolus umbonatus]|nr:Aldehyde/histidinol dehydrogenase [Pilobolus umbonatus]
MSDILHYTSTDSIEDYVSHVSQIFLTGKTKDIKWRKQQLQNLYNMVKENEEAFYEALAKDLNKPRPEALGGDIAPVLDECLYFIDNLDRLAKDQKVKARLLVNAFEKTIIRREPLGTVLVIGCWNYPVQLALCPLVGVIAAGNVAILKLSEISVHTSALITRLFSRYMDASCYRVVNGSVMETTALLQHKFDHIFYTGNSTVAKIIMEAAAKHLTPVTLELGGKSPAIVAEDADITLTATRVAFGKFFNAGQTCIAVDYVLIHQSRADEFISALRKAIDKFYGSNAAKSKDYVRIINDRHFERLSNVLKNRKSGEIAIGGDFTKETRYISPTVIKNVAFNDPSLMGDELFGPLLPVITYNNIDEAICNINKKDHPLALYIFSNKKPLVEKVLRQVRSGGVTVNDCLMHQAEYAMPFGGVGASGMGHYHGERSFLTFSHERSMLIKKQSGEAMMSTRYPPYNSSKYNMMRFILVKHPAFIWLKTYSKSLKFVTLLMALISFYFKRRA